MLQVRLWFKQARLVWDGGYYLLHSKVHRAKAIGHGMGTKTAHRVGDTKTYAIAVKGSIRLARLSYLIS